MEDVAVEDVALRAVDRSGVLLVAEAEPARPDCDGAERRDGQRRQPPRDPIGRGARGGGRRTAADHLPVSVGELDQRLGQEELVHRPVGGRMAAGQPLEVAHRVIAEQPAPGHLGGRGIRWKIQRGKEVHGVGQRCVASAPGMGEHGELADGQRGVATIGSCGEHDPAFAAQRGGGGHRVHRRRQRHDVAVQPRPGGQRRPRRGDRAEVHPATPAERRGHPELGALVVADRFAHRVPERGELDRPGWAALDEDAEIAALVEAVADQDHLTPQRRHLHLGTGDDRHLTVPGAQLIGERTHGRGHEPAAGRAGILGVDVDACTRRDDLDRRLDHVERELLQRRATHVDVLEREWAHAALVRVAQIGDAVRVEAGQHADRDVEGDGVAAGGQESHRARAPVHRIVALDHRGSVADDQILRAHQVEVDGGLVDPGHVHDPGRVPGQQSDQVLHRVGVDDAGVRAQLRHPDEVVAVPDQFGHRDRHPAATSRRECW